MPIHPLPQFEADLESDRKLYESLKPPTSIVVRFGIMKLVGEFPYSGDAKPGCGSKLVVRSHRGTEMGEMLTSTCPNSGCSKSVSRKEMLEYIENSGGKDYPFFNQGRILRIATLEDMNQQAKLDAERPKMVMEARRIVGELGLPMKVVDAEPLLGAERLTFYFTSEERIDFRDLVNQLAPLYHTRIEMRQVGARDEARLVADYERCGQHCCCKQFLKVLKPVSMKSAKIQKATLDPLKISGRCGRLMCCLRYEDQTYDELRKRLPRKKSRVQTPSGWGIVIDAQILTQLVLVRLEDSDTDVAIPVEEIGTGPQADTGPEDDIETDVGEALEGAAQPARERGPSGGGDRPARRERGERPQGPEQQPRGERPPARQDRPPAQPQPRGDRPQGGREGGREGGGRDRARDGGRDGGQRRGGPPGDGRSGRPPQERGDRPPRQQGDGGGRGGGGGVGGRNDQGRRGRRPDGPGEPPRDRPEGSGPRPPTPPPPPPTAPPG
jgi:cell fate regulator YaaT (PSP1 superfamily)